MSSDLMKPVIAAVQERFRAQVDEFRGEVTATIAPHQNVEAAAMLRDEFQFEMLVDVTAVDYWPQEEPRFHVVYQLYSMRNNLLLRLRVPLNGSLPHVRTVEGIYPSANWFEREVWDLFGIRFDNHSDPRRIIMPADWDGHPLRKDYPLGYEEVQFSFNQDQVSQHKPSPKN